MLGESPSPLAIGGRVLTRCECREFLVELNNVSPERRDTFLQYFVGFWQMQSAGGVIVVNQGALAMGSVEQQQAVSVGFAPPQPGSFKMSIEALAAGTVAAIIPYLLKAAEGAAGKAGEAGFETATKILTWMRAKLGGRSREALDDLEKAPADELNQADLRKQLIKALEADEALQQELRALLPAEAEDADGMIQTVSGAGAKAAQVRGSGNTTNIG